MMAPNPSPEGNASSAVSLVPPGSMTTHQEFPPAQPATLRAEETSLESLVHQRETVEASTPLEVAYRAFRERGVDYMAVVVNGAVTGLCSRGQVGFVMGSRFGFSLYSQSPVSTTLVPNPLIIVHG